MKGYDASTYGDRIAAVYDELTLDLDTAESVETLAELAGRGPVLELGIGTGRVAIPLARRGLDVYGIDASEDMIARLQESAQSLENIHVVIGDFAEITLDVQFRLVFAVFNTFFFLTTQDEQVQCFQTVADHLEPGGVFAIETFAPRVMPPMDRVESTAVQRVDADEVVLNVIRHDLANQRVDMQEITLSGSGIRFYPAVLRYAWPSELDLMARLAGLRLRDRWSSWGRAALTSQSGRQISIYKRDD